MRASHISTSHLARRVRDVGRRSKRAIRSRSTSTSQRQNTPTVSRLSGTHTSRSPVSRSLVSSSPCSMPMGDTMRQNSRDLGRRVAAARRAANLTQVELAAKLNWPNDTLINYENGRRPLSLARLAPIHHALDLPPPAPLLH